MYFLILFLIIINILFAVSPAYSQFKYQLYAESGYFNSKETMAESSIKLLTRLSGEARFDYKEENRHGSIILNLRPEIYGGRNYQHIFKGKASASYYQQEELFGWGINLSRQRNIYGGNVDHYNYDMFFLTGETEWYIFEDLPLIFNLGYGYQEADLNINQHYDILFSEIKLFSNLPETIT